MQKYVKTTKARMDISEFNSEGTLRMLDQFKQLWLNKKTSHNAAKIKDKNAKVVMASSVGSQNYLKDAINAGAYDFIQKPIQNEHLLRLLNNLVKEG